MKRQSFIFKNARKCLNKRTSHIRYMEGRGGQQTNTNEENIQVYVLWKYWMHFDISKNSFPFIQIAI